MIIKLKKLPDFEWTMALQVLTEEEVLEWAGDRQVYYCEPMDVYLVRADEIRES